MDKRRSQPREDGTVGTEPSRGEIGIINRNYKNARKKR